MVQATLKWIVVLAALFALGPAAARLTGSLRAEDGSHAVSLLTDGQIGMGLLAGLGAMAIACVAGAISAKLINRDMGMTIAGLVVAWATWRMGEVERIVVLTGGGGVLTKVAIEGLILGLVGVGIAAAVCSVSRGASRANALFGHASEGVHNDDRARLRLGLSAGCGAGVVAGGVVAWLIGVESLKGQCVMAAVIAGIAAGAAGELTASRWRVRLGVLAPCAALAVLALAGPIVAKVMGGADVVGVALRGKLAPIGKISPMDWVAGMLLGVPIGLAWAHSMLEKEPAPATA